MFACFRRRILFGIRSGTMIYLWLFHLIAECLYTLRLEHYRDYILQRMFL